MENSTDTPGGTALFETFGERHAWIEELYDQQRYARVVMETGKLAEELMQRLIGGFHATLTSPEQRQALLAFEEQNATSLQRFLAGPTIGVSIGLYNALLERFQPHDWLAPQARGHLNSLNALRNQQAHSGAQGASDDDASDALDHLEDLLDLVGFRTLPREDAGVPLACFLVYKSLVALFGEANDSQAFEAIVSDARKLLPPLLEGLLQKLYPRMEAEQKQLLLSHGTELVDHSTLLGQLVKPLRIPQGEDLVRKLEQIAEAPRSLNRRTTKAHVRVLDIVVGMLLESVSLEQLEYADEVKKRYLAGGRIDFLEQAQLEAIADLRGIERERAERIADQVIRVIDAALVPYQTLVRTAAGPAPALDDVAVPSEESPVAAPAAPLHNLPARQGAYIEPESCFDRLLELVRSEDDVHLVGVVGFPGVGKSRLALEVAARCVEERSFDAVIWLSGQRTELTSFGVRTRCDAIESIEQLLDELAFALDQSELAKLPTLRHKSQAIAKILATTSCLLVVDGIDDFDVPVLLQQLRTFSPLAKVLVTSRCDPGTTDHSLTVPCPGLEGSLALMQAECRRKGLHEVDDEVLRNLYDATGGLPLAMIWSIGLLLELPAHRVLHLLKSAKGDLLTYCFGNSLAELEPEARFTLGLAALFVGPASYDALSDIAEQLQRPDDIDPGIRQLLRLSLIRRERRYRYSMLPLTADLAPGVLGEDGQPGQELAAGFAEHFCSQARRWSSTGRAGMEQILVQRGNLRRALDWLRRQPEAERQAAFSELTRNLHEVLWLHGYWNELVRYNELAWEICTRLERWESAGQHAYTIGFTLFQQGRFDESTRWGERATEAMARTDDPYHQTRVMRLPAMNARIRGELETSRQLQHHMIDTARELLEATSDEERRRAIRSDILVDALTSLGNLERDVARDYGLARTLYAESLALNRQMDHREKIGLNLNHSGRTDLLEYAEVVDGDSGGAAALLESARRNFAEGKEVSKAVPRTDQILIGMWGLARVAEERGEFEAARALATAALAEYGHSGAAEVADIEELIARL